MPLPKPIFDIHDPVFPLFFQTALILWLERKGASYEELFKNTHLTKETLTDPKARINFITMTKLVENASTYWGKPGLGLAYGGKLSLASIGILGQASMSSHSNRESCAVFVKYFNIRTSVVNLSMEETKNSLTFIFESNIPESEEQRFYIDAALAGATRMLELLVNREIKASVTLKRSDGGYKDLYEKMFNVGTQFHAERNTVTFYSKTLDKKLRTADPMTLAQAVEMCEVQLQNVKHVISVRQSVLNILNKRKSDLPSLNEAAKTLAMSPRTLSRHLKNSGLTYSQCLTDVRSEEAKRYLRNTDFTIADIAHKLGYDSPANFTRAFKKWFSQTPLQYRKRLEESEK